jgi:peptide/nickel transport system permease protein
MNPSVQSVVESKTGLAPQELPKRKWSLFFKRFARNKLSVVGGVIFVGLILVTLLSPWITTHDPILQDYANVLKPSGNGHLLGTDDLGRDTFSRLIYGARLALEASLIAVGIAFLIGVPLGLISGYFGGFWDDWIIMRVVDAMQAFPSVILAMAMAAALGGGFINAIIAIGIGFFPAFVRITRAQVLTVRRLEYVQAAKAIGAGNLRIIFLHVFPNVMGPLIVQTTLTMAAAIIAEAGLSYLGLGAKPEEPSWGSMLRIAQGYLNVDPILAIWPGLAIFLVVLGFNLLGDGLREVLDPKLKR